MNDTNQISEGAAEEHPVMPQTKIVSTDPKYGPIREVTIRKFKAFEGWMMRAEAIKYLKSDDADFIAQFTINTLSTATVDGKHLANAKAVDEMLSHWRNVKVVFEEVLTFNGIDTAMEEYAAEMWDVAGERFANSFITHATSLVEPGLRSIFTLDEKEAN